MRDESQQMQDWMEVKIRLNKSRTIFHVKEGEIWWAAVGKNIGIEINGKGNGFARQVIIYKKLSKLGFIGIPLTTQKHGGSWYRPLTVGEKHAYAVLSQIKTMSIYRLYRRICQLSVSDLEYIEKGVFKFLQ